MILPFPIKAPGMSPTEMRSIKWREDFVPHRLIVVSSQPSKRIVKSDVPRISEPAREDFQILAIRIALENASFSAPIVLWIVVILSVRPFFEDRWLGQVRQPRQIDA